MIKGQTNDSHADMKDVRILDRASAGGGVVPGSQPAEIIKVPGHLYRQTFGHRSESQVGYFEIVGDSATPYYMQGERVPVEIIGPTQDYTSGELYVFRWHGDLLMKRLVRQDEGHIEAISLNRSVPTFDVVPADGNEFTIWGLVLQSPVRQFYSSLINRIRVDPKELT